MLNILKRIWKAVVAFFDTSPKEIKIRGKLPWPNEDIKRAVYLGLEPESREKIDTWGIVIAIQKDLIRLSNGDVGAGGTNGGNILLWAGHSDRRLSDTALPHELNHIKRLMSGDKNWKSNTDEACLDGDVLIRSYLRLKGL